MAAVPASSHLLLSGQTLNPKHKPSRAALLLPPKNTPSQHAARSARVVRCMAIDAAPATTKAPKSSYELLTLTTWLLKQEQAGAIDAELTIVLSSISMACKQIAALVQRAGISNLTGVQGAVNVQGEDQKKLDVVSNEVPTYLKLKFILLLHGLIRDQNKNNRCSQIA